MNDSQTAKPTISTEDVRAFEKAIRQLKKIRDDADKTMQMLLSYLSERKQLP